MKNRIKKSVAVLLSVVMLLTTAPLVGFDGLFALKSSAAYAVGDHIQYGNYSGATTPCNSEIHSAYHNMEQKEEKYATCTESGYVIKVCTDCGYEETLITPALGHKWGEQDDYGNITCVFCGCTEVRNYMVKFYIESDTGLFCICAIGFIEKNTVLTDSQIPTPKKADTATTSYVFKGWYKKGDETKTPVEVEKTIVADAEYVAIFEETDSTNVYINKPVGFTAEKVSGNALISFNPSWFSGNSSVYNHDLAKLTSKFAMLGYASKEELKNALETIGFTVDEKYIDLETGKKRNGETDIEEAKKRVNYFIAHKKMTVNGEKTTLVFMGLIGSSHNQWYSNFDPGSGSVHNGFYNAKRFITNSSKTGRLDSYFSKYIKYYAENVKILITGHSRGAATANLVAADLINTNRYAAKKDIFTYAYATPNSTDIEYCSDEQYNRIFNFVNPEDFVTKCMPSEWRYGRYGITYTLPSKTNEGGFYSRYYDNMNKRFKEYYGEKSYQPYKEGEKPVYDVVKKLTTTVGTVNEMYLKKMRSGTGLKSTYEFFQSALCPIVADNGILEFIGGLKNMLMAWFMPTTSKTFDKVTDFFLKYEGAAMIKSLLGETGVDVASLSVLVGRSITMFPVIKAEQLLSWARNGQNNFSHAHLAQTYAAFIDSMTEEQIKKKRKSYLNTVKCPVDIEVYEKSTGELVGKITNNVIDETVAAKENAIVMGVDGDSKSFWLPSNEDYEVKLIGNDEGTMDYTVANVDPDLGETERVNFFDVEITDGLTMSGEMKTDTALEDYSLEYDNGNKMTPAETLSGDEITSYNINVSVEGNGYATESMTASSGDYVALNATADENSKFVGWYENGEKISDESELSFVAKGDRELTAKFEDEQEEPEPPEQPDDPSANCNHICHKGGISKFFYKIALFFWKLFKTNKYCSCGAAHY